MLFHLTSSPNKAHRRLSGRKSRRTYYERCPEALDDLLAMGQLVGNSMGFYQGKWMSWVAEGGFAFHDLGGRRSHVPVFVVFLWECVRVR